MVHDLAFRLFDQKKKFGKRPVLLYMGDLDPSGVSIPRTLVRDMADYHHVEVELVRVALNLEQIEEYDLPDSTLDAKQKDPNYQAWLEEFGPNQRPYELDSMHPAQLTEVIERALTDVFDMDLYNQELIRETQEVESMVQAKHDVKEFLYREHRALVSESSASADFE